MKSKALFVWIIVLAGFFVCQCQAELVAHLPFDGDAKDVSGNGNHGTATAGITYVQGRFGKAIYTGAKNDYVELANEENFDFTGPMTICAWIKIPEGSLSGSYWTAVVIKDAWRMNVLASHFGLSGSHAFENSGLSPYYINADDSDNYPGINDGKWHHIVVVYDGRNMMLYTDSVLNKMTKHEGTPGVGDAPVRIGGGSNFDALLPLNGYIDEVRLYDEALSAEEINIAMNDLEDFRVSDPEPREWVEDVSLPAELSWAKPLEIERAEYKVYVGTDPELKNVKGVDVGGKVRFSPELDLNRTYYWRVDTVDSNGKTYKGDVWNFRTSAAKASLPSPADDANDIGQKTVLSWKPEKHGGPYEHLVYIGKSPETMVQVAALPSDKNSYEVCLEPGKAYYWQVKEDDGDEVFDGDIWMFKTSEPKKVCSGQEKTIYSCSLGVGDKRFPSLPGGIVGRYDAEGRVIFEEKPIKTWDFMATGTGTTGFTVTVDRGVRIQINHADAYDGQAFQRPLGILRIDGWDDLAHPKGYKTKEDPFADAENIRMVHDLKRSCIRVTAETKTGPVHMDIRSNIEMDVTCIDIIDERAGAKSRPFDFNLRNDQSTGQEVTEDGVHLNWHVNKESVYAKANEFSGFSMPEDDNVLLGRCFGTAICFDADYGDSQPGKLAYRLLVAADSNKGGLEAWKSSVLSKIKAVKSKPGNGFVENHERWWSDFWKRSYFEPEPKEGDTRFIKQKASFDLYRYYIACCSSDRREFPVRFMNDVFRYNDAQYFWSVMDITALETYQSIYGAMRTGDMSALRSRLSYYIRTMPLFKKHSEARFGHEGMVAPYETNVWGSWGYWNGSPVAYYTEKNSPYLRYSWSGNLWMILAMCDYVDISGDVEFANDGLREFASEVIAFFKNHFSERDENGDIVFYPASAGETWCGVKNPAELSCAFRTILPRLIKIAEEQGWDRKKIAEWEKFYSSIPEIPLGRLVKNKDNHKWEIKDGELLVPAEDFSKLETPGSINHQHTELFAIWPTKLFLRDKKNYETALNSYRERMWKHGSDGWNLDVVFAANLGLTEEVDEWYDRHFDVTNVFPCGLAQETSYYQDDYFGISYSPSMQGMGTCVIPVLDRLMQDYEDELILLPAWPKEVPVKFALYSPFAGSFEVDYEPGEKIEVKTEREIKVTVPEEMSKTVELVVNK